MKDKFIMILIKKNMKIQKMGQMKNLYFCKKTVNN